MKCPWCHPQRPCGLHCVRCLQHVYRVQNAAGERFLVDHYGRVNCPAGAQ